MSDARCNSAVADPEGDTPSAATAAPPKGAPEPVYCSRCEAWVQAQPDGRCPTCKAFTPKNQAAWKHGLRAFRDRGQLPEGLAQNIESFEEELISDLGGSESLTALTRSLARSAKELEAVKRLALTHALKKGIGTPEGRQSLDRYLAALDRLRGIAQQLGLQRRSKPVPSLREALDSIPVEESP